MASATPEQRMSEFVAALTFDDLPDEAVETVQRAFVDTIGVTLAGAVTGAGRTAFETAGIDPTTADAGTLLGIERSDCPESTALRIGTASHALDYDDLSWAMDGHPSVTLVPPLLVLADECNASGAALITAYAAGFEVECAIAEPISPAHYERGWHATSTFGAFGAAVATAHLVDLDREAIERVLNVTASMPGGIKRNFGSMTKPLHAGLCSRAGVTATRLVQNGFTAGSTAISGEQGFWDLYAPQTPAAFSCGDRLTLVSEGIHSKVHPCCYFTHTSIAATQALTDGIDPDAIERIEVEVAGGAGDALVNPAPETNLEAKFSMEYAVAVAALRDRVDLSAFTTDVIADPDVGQLRKRVDFTVDPELDYDSHEATVRIHTADGVTERHQVNPPGTHSDPLSETALQRKFEDCASRALPSDEVERLARALSSLPTLPNAADALTSR